MSIIHLDYQTFRLEDWQMNVSWTALLQGYYLKSESLKSESLKGSPLSIIDSFPFSLFKIRPSVGRGYGLTGWSDG